MISPEIFDILSWIIFVIYMITHMMTCLTFRNETDTADMSYNYQILMSGALKVKLNHIMWWIFQDFDDHWFSLHFRLHSQSEKSMHNNHRDDFFRRIFDVSGHPSTVQNINCSIFLYQKYFPYFEENLWSYIFICRWLSFTFRKTLKNERNDSPSFHSFNIKWIKFLSKFIEI